MVVGALAPRQGVHDVPAFVRQVVGFLAVVLSKPTARRGIGPEVATQLVSR